MQNPQATARSVVSFDDHDLTSSVALLRPVRRSILSWYPAGMRSGRYRARFLLPALVLSCAASCQENAHWVVESCPSVQVSVDPPDEFRTIDDDLADLAGRVAGFGGYAFDGGVLKVYLVEPSPELGQAAQSELAAMLDAPELATALLEMLRGRHDYIELNDWFDLAANLLSLSGVEYVDIDEGKNRLEVGASDDVVAGCVPTNLDELGIPVDVVAIRRVAPIELE